MPETAAPSPDLQRVLDFVNTHELDPPREELSDPDALGGWLGARGLLDGATTATAAHLRRAIELREALRVMLLAHHGATAGEDDAREANRVLAAIPLRLAFDDAGDAALVPAADGVDGALARLIAPIPSAVADGTWQRAKICPADDCDWAFYDRSRNRSRRWCSMEVCGNREKSRAFRGRHEA
jgi:predicted RNA-binding Zn ribbon-like protein